MATSNSCPVASIYRIDGRKRWLVIPQSMGGNMSVCLITQWSSRSSNVSTLIVSSDRNWCVADEDHMRTMCACCSALYEYQSSPRHARLQKVNMLRDEHDLIIMLLTRDGRDGWRWQYSGKMGKMGKMQDGGESSTSAWVFRLRYLAFSGLVSSISPLFFFFFPRPLNCLVFS